MRTILIPLTLVWLAAVACQPLDEPPMARGPLEIETLAEGVDAIPLQYGNLVAVAPLPGQPFTQVLWFEQADRSLVAVRVNASLGSITQVLTVPRR
jgi:hypothetical protein